MDTVFVGNLSFFCTQEHLVQLFSSVVPIRSAAIVKTKDGKTCYYGFIYLENEEDAAKVLDQFNGMKFMGRNIRIGIRSNEASRQVVDDSTVQMFVRFLSEKLEEDVTEAILDSIFAKFGSVADCIVKEYTRFDSSPPVQSGYAFVHVHHIDIAQKIMKRFNSDEGKKSDDISFKISLSRQCSERLGGELKDQKPEAESAIVANEMTGESSDTMRQSSNKDFKDGNSTVFSNDPSLQSSQLDRSNRVTGESRRYHKNTRHKQQNNNGQLPAHEHFQRIKHAQDGRQRHIVGSGSRMPTNAFHTMPPHFTGCAENTLAMMESWQHHNNNVNNASMIPPTISSPSPAMMMSPNPTMSPQNQMIMYHSSPSMTPSTPSSFVESLAYTSSNTSNTSIPQGYMQSVIPPNILYPMFPPQLLVPMQYPSLPPSAAGTFPTMIPVAGQPNSFSSFSFPILNGPNMMINNQHQNSPMYHPQQRNRGMG